MDKGSASIFTPALISGSIFGFLGGAPFVGLLNCVCCSLILAAGLTAAFLYSRSCRASGIGFDSMAGVKVGLLAGVVYALADTITSTISGLLFHEATTKWILEAVDEFAEVPPEAMEMVSAGMERGLLPGIAFSLVTNLGFGIIFGVLGGLIGGAVFKSGPGEAPPQPENG